MVLFIQFSDLLFRPVVAFGDQTAHVLRARAASARIFRLFDWTETLRKPTSPAAPPRDLHGKIEFRDLSFGYGEGSDVPHRIGLIVNPGAGLAIVGPTGSGKTTLTRLICRYYDAPDPSLFIDVMQGPPREIRERVGVIFQDFHIFADAAGNARANERIGDIEVGFPCPRLVRFDLRAGLLNLDA